MNSWPNPVSTKPGEDSGTDRPPESSNVKVYFLYCLGLLGGLGGSMVDLALVFVSLPISAVHKRRGSLFVGRDSTPTTPRRSPRPLLRQEGSLRFRDSPFDLILSVSICVYLWFHYYSCFSSASSVSTAAGGSTQTASKNPPPSRPSSTHRPRCDARRSRLWPERRPG